MTADLSSQRIDTRGGAVVEGDLRVGRDFVGRDQLIQYNQFVTVVFTGLAIERVPYVAERPFRRNEQTLFAGREETISRMLDLTNDPERRAIVVCGPAGIGKTSLLAAGVVPLLDPAETNPPIPLRDYGRASPFLRVELYLRAQKMGLDLSEETPAPELIRAITRACSQRLVLILDQFERFFQPDVSEPERNALRRDLSGAIAAVEPHLFQIIIAIRDDVKSVLDRQWDDLLPGLRQSTVYLGPLSRAQAKQAIKQPLDELHTNPVFDKTFLDCHLLPDLDRLSPTQPGYILPADLQIVCSQLFQTARNKQEQIIDSTLYFAITDGKGAEHIIDTRFDGLMARVSGERRDWARRIATEMLDRGPQAWLAPDQLPGNGAGPADIQATLDEMSTAEMVIWHVTSGTPPGRAYALASDSIARAAERALGREAQKRRRARQELEYVWQDWVKEDSWASKYQVNLLEQNYADGPLPPEMALLLLGSAVARQMPVDHWLKQLDNIAACSLIRELEGGQVLRGQEDEQSGEPTRQSQASRILALSDDEDLAPWPSVRPALRVKATGDDQPPLSLRHHRLARDEATEDQGGGLQGGPASVATGQQPSAEFGPVAWSAAAHRKKAACREIAALALLAAYSPDALERYGSDGLARNSPDALVRIEAAVRTGRLSRWRLAELLGILVDASPDLAVRLRERPLSDRLKIWWWRFRRRLIRDLPYIGSVALGGAVGAGLGLGLLRAMLAPLVQEKPGYAFYAAFAVAFLFGLAVSLGLLLANPIYLLPPEHGSMSTGRRPLLPAIALGALCFGLMHVLHLLLFGASSLPAAIFTSALALPAGAALSLAVHNKPVPGWHIGIPPVLHLAVVAVVFALVQALFVLARNYGTGLVFAWTGSFYRSGLSDTLYHWRDVLHYWGFDVNLAIPNWFHYVAVIDAGLTGIVLVVGLAAGLNLADHWFRKWESLAHLIGE